MDEKRQLLDIHMYFLGISIPWGIVQKYEFIGCWMLAYSLSYFRFTDTNVI
jgi:hypothetical protein